MGIRSAQWSELTEWLLGNGRQVSKPVAAQMSCGLYTSIPIFLGGVINSVAVASVAVWRHPSAPFLIWLMLEITLAVARLPVVAHGRRALRRGDRPLLGLTAALACAWAASVGYGTFLCLTSGDWVLATIGSMSAAAMVCGICLRNFGTPRLAGAMVVLMLAPCAVAGVVTAEPVVGIITLQVPIYIVVIISSAFSLNTMMVARMAAMEDLAQSESFVNSVLASGPDYTLVLDEGGQVIFCNQPPDRDPYPLLGKNWLDLVPAEDRDKARAAMHQAEQGLPGSLTTCYSQSDGRVLWFDVIVQRISDSAGRKIVVARDITDQKQSEEQALWLARHDPLTGLPNRSVLQESLDRVLDDGRAGIGGALLIIDVDNFKLINDTIGHDGGDALLCAIARRLVTAADGAFVARTGGDEFAMLIPAKSRQGVEDTAGRIFAQMAEPFRYGRHVVESGASVGASLLHMDGLCRSEVLGTADIALYAAKSEGRARLKIFEPAMKAQVERRQKMMASARRALQHDRIFPHYQPKIALDTLHISGFEALLRWRDEDGHLRGPQTLDAAIHDPRIGPRLSARMLDRVLDDVAHWLEQGLPFGDIALNVAMVDFRSPTLAANLLSRLRARNIPPSCLQIEVTETVLLGGTADAVEGALRVLRDNGIRIALDDFGTGYASLSHLQRFPVDVLKIDKAFVQDIGKGPDVEAISAAVINLGHCMGLQVVAEGIETAAQEAHLRALGCDIGQGFYYSGAVPAEQVPGLLRGQTSWTPQRCKSA